jgi:hypothetical protein
MDTSKLKPGDSIAPCQEAPTLRVREEAGRVGEDLEKSEGYTSRGYIRHFLPDREVNLGHLNQALADVFGEPALRLLNMNIVIDEGMWRQVCSDPWGGNAYRYAFRSPDTPINEVSDLATAVQKLQAEVDALKKRLG